MVMACRSTHWNSEWCNLKCPHNIPLGTFHLRRYRKTHVYLYGCHKNVHTHVNHGWIEIEWNRYVWWWYGWYGYGKNEPLSDRVRLSQHVPFLVIKAVKFDKWQMHVDNCWFRTMEPMHSPAVAANKQLLTGLVKDPTDWAESKPSLQGGDIVGAETAGERQNWHQTTS
jgi:hypothetical protein